MFKNIKEAYNEGFKRGALFATKNLVSQINYIWDSHEWGEDLEERVAEFIEKYAYITKKRGNK